MGQRESERRVIDDDERGTWGGVRRRFRGLEVVMFRG